MCNNNNNNNATTQIKTGKENLKLHSFCGCWGMGPGDRLTDRTDNGNDRQINDRQLKRQTDRSTDSPMVVSSTKMSKKKTEFGKHL